MFDKYKIDNQQAIVVNYFVCVLTAGVAAGGNPIPLPLHQQAWFIHSILLGALFILVFNIMALAVQKSGIMIATIFQKMSLIAPTFLAILFYNESSGYMKWSGILLAIVSIVLISYNSDNKSQTIKPESLLLFPALTFLGSCMIDSSIFLIEKQGFVQNGDIGFVATLFLFAGITGAIIWLYQYISGKTNFAWKNVIAGICLGVPNFFSIYLLFVALQQGIEGSVVFPVNNAGVLLLSSLYGILIFSEPLNRYKIAGFFLAIMAILLISYS
jgi:drug/metabolite transporter (DMT)-like permease